ncbi:hypothetical protein LDENG_00133310, partial [Lucifuga dentata]
MCMEASEVLEVSGHVGGNVSFQCSWNTNSSSNNYNMYFCKGVCSKKNALIQTERETSAVRWRGRYGMEVGRAQEVFNMTIKSLKKANAGRYHCGWERNATFFSQEINLRVLD